MKKIIFLIPVVAILLGCNKKLEKLEGNNVGFEETYFQIEEVISMEIPNSALDFGGFLNCTSLPFGLTQDFNAFIPTQNPNPYAHLVDQIKPSKVIMELTNIPDCDFNMLESVEIYLVDLLDTCGNLINDESKFVFKSDAVSYNGSCSINVKTGPYYNVVKLGEFLNFSNGIGNIIELDLTPNTEIDQFIHAGNFQTYAKLVFDKAFTEESAIIKTTMVLDVRLINED